MKLIILRWLLVDLFGIAAIFLALLAFTDALSMKMPHMLFEAMGAVAFGCLAQSNANIIDGIYQSPPEG